MPGATELNINKATNLFLNSISVYFISLEYIVSIVIGKQIVSRCLNEYEMRFRSGKVHKKSCNRVPLAQPQN